MSKRFELQLASTSITSITSMQCHSVTVFLKHRHEAPSAAKMAPYKNVN